MRSERNAVKEFILWGGTGQAKVLRECLSNLDLSLVALFDNNETIQPPFVDIPVFFGKRGFESWIAHRNRDRPLGFLVAIGGDRGRDRVALQDYLESHGLIALCARHRSAFVADSAVVARGSQILANAAVCVEARLGRACIVNTGATVDHECQLGDGVHVCPGAHLAGLVEVGNFVMIGTGAIILPRISIGEGTIVGAGAVVTADVAPRAVVVGNPARPLVRRGS